MEYKTRLDPLVLRQITRWGLSDSLLMDVYIHLNYKLPRSPTMLLRDEPTWFGGEGMVYDFDLIDLQNRMLVHAFRFQVFYQTDEQTLLVTRATHVTAEGI